MPLIVYVLLAAALLLLIVVAGAGSRRKRAREPKGFDWTRRHNWWSRWRARNAFPNGR